MNGQPKSFFTIDDIRKLEERYRQTNSNLSYNIPDRPFDIDSYNEQSKVKERDVYDWLPDVVKKAYNESITGMTEQLITGEQRFDLKNYNPGVMADIGASILSFFMPADFIATVAGMGVGGIVGKTAAKVAVGKAMKMGGKRLANAGVKKSVGDKVMKSGLEKILTESGRQSAGFGVYTGISSALKQQIDTNEVDWREVLSESSKASISAGIGGAVLGRAAAKGTAKGLAYTQEAVAFGTVDPLLEGRAPSPMDYAMSVGTALGLTAVPASAKKLNNYVKNFLAKEDVGNRNAFSNLSLEDLGKQNTIAKIVAETQWEAQRGVKRWEAVSPEVGKSAFLDVSIISKTTKKGEDAFRILDNLSPEQSKQTISKKEFFKRYKESKKSRLKTEANIIDMEAELGVRDIDQFITAVTNGKKKSLSDFTDKELLSFQANSFKKYQNALWRKNYAEYSADIPETDLFVHVFGEKVANQLRMSHKTFSDKGAQAVVKTFFDVQEGISAFESLSRVEIEAAKKIMGRNKSRLERIYKEATGRQAETEANREAVQAIRKWAESRFNYARGGGIVPKGRIEKYLPKILQAKYKEAIFDDYMKIEKESLLNFTQGALNDSDKAVLQKIISNKIINNKTSKGFNVLMDDIIRQYRKVQPNMTYAEAYALLRDDIRPSRVNPHGMLENKRKFDIPLSLLETNPITLMAIYDSRLARRVETSKVFGRNNEGIDKAIAEVSTRNPGEGRRLAILADRLTGIAEADLSMKRSPELRKFTQAAMGFEAMTKIAGGDATILNLAQTLISTLPTLGAMRTAKGFLKIMNKDFRNKLPTVYVDFIREVVGEASSSSLMRKLSDKASKLSGFTAVNKFNNLLSSATAKIAIDDYIRMYQRNPTGVRGRYAKKKLRKLFNIDADNLQKLTEDKLAGSITSFTRRSQLQRDFMYEQMWLGNPELRPLLMFKSFGIKQAGFISDQIKQELKMGNPMIVARLALGGFAGAAGINYLKGKVSEFFSGRKYEPKEDTQFNEFVHSFGTIGAFGMLSDFIDAEDLGRQFKFILTPVFVSDLGKMIDGIGELSKSIDEFGFTPTAMRRAAHKVSPIFGTNARRLSERFIQTQAQKRNAQRTRKGKVRTDALDLLSEEKTDLAIRRVKQWNRLNPTNPITYNDINNKEVYKYLMRKHMKVETENMTPQELQAYNAFMRGD